MGVLIEWGQGKFFVVPDGGHAIIGRDTNVEVVLSSSKVSRHHAEIRQEGSTWFLRDLEAANGTFLGSNKISRIALTASQSVLIGGARGTQILVTLTATTKSMSPDMPPGTNDSVSTSEMSDRIILPPHLKIGSHADNNVRTGGDGVAEFHAVISTNQRGSHDLVHVAGAGATFINGLALRRRAALRPGDTVGVGQWLVRYTGHALEHVDAQGGFSFVADSVSLALGSKVLLDDVSFELQPRTLTAVVGPSGSGKSTLMSVLTAKSPASSGSISYAGRDLYEHYDELRNRIGFVPQSDLLHLKLRTREALEYAAALRFPQNTTAEERAERIDDVLEVLGLTERAAVPIEKLSGGQRKRTSVALELLTEPSLLFLDEPTSGLDPGLDRQVMNLLRDLANDGRTVLVVTHSVANLDVCDEVIVMAPGGRLAYQGAPYGVLAFFGAKDWSEVFDVLHSPESSGWQSKKKASPGLSNPEKPELPNIRQQPWLFQLGILCMRYFRVVVADRAYAAVLVALPFIMATVGLATGNDYGLARGPASDLFYNPQARSLLLIFILGSSFMGLAASVQELVKERAIFERERSIGLSAGAYLLSKIIVLGAIVSVQTILFVVLSLADRDLPERGLVMASARAEVVLVTVLLAVTSMMLGLLISSVVKSADVTMPALVLVTMAQVVFSGAVPLRASGLVDVVGLINPGYWTMNALGATVGLNKLAGLSGDDAGTFWEPVSENLILGVLALFIAMITIAIGTRFTLGRTLSS